MQPTPPEEDDVTHSMHAMEDGAEERRVSTPEELWLSGVEQEAWRTFLYATTLLNDRFSEALQSDPEIDLTLGEYEILVRLSEAENKFLRMSELADKVVHSRSRLTHTISRMERRGLVERVRCTNDGRGRQPAHRAGERMLERRPTHALHARPADVISRDDLLRAGPDPRQTLAADARR